MLASAARILKICVCILCIRALSSVYISAHRKTAYDYCERLCGCWELKSGPLAEQWVPLAAEPSPGPDSHCAMVWMLTSVPTLGRNTLLGDGCGETDLCVISKTRDQSSDKQGLENLSASLCRGSMWPEGAGGKGPVAEPELCPGGSQTLLL